MKQLNLSTTAITGLISLLALASCDKGSPSFSLPAESSTFFEAPSFEEIPRDVDILWIIDNSGSMRSSQENLTNNFPAFIQQLKSKKYNFRMAVQNTEAWKGKFNGQNATYRRIKDGVGTTHSGVFVMKPTTPNLDSVFMINAMQGINGVADERAFSSFLDTLDYSGNSDFRRAGAYLAVIILSDEDDFSATTSSSINQNYSSSNIIPISTYKTFLNNHAGVGNYSVNVITILDNTCKNQLNAMNPGRIIGQRYIQLADQTGGTKTSLCAPFGDSLRNISDTIVGQAPPNTSYRLGREPIPSSIIVKVNGANVMPDAVNGFTYAGTATTWTVELHGTAAQAILSGGTVSITYDPLNPTN